MQIVVLEIPGLHQGFLGCYGNEWVETPALNRMAAEGIVFDRHYADCISDEFRSCWTGLSTNGPIQLPLHHVLLKHTFEAPFEIPQLPVFPSDNLLWLETPSLAPPWPFMVSDEAIDPLDPEIDWEDPDNVLDLQDAYGEIVSLTDKQVDRLLSMFPDAMTIVTSRLGCAMAEHGVVGMSGALHNELVHLPLLIRMPNGEQAGRRIASFTQPIDLYPTLMEALNQPLPKASEGFSLWPVMRGLVSGQRAHARTWRACDGGVALHTPDWTYLEGDPPRLYQMPDDRWHVNDLSQRLHHIMDDMHLLLENATEPIPAPDAHDTNT